MSENVVHVSDRNFSQEVLKSNVPVLVDFWAPWCGPCMALGPTIERIAESFLGKVKVCKVNVDENQQTAAQFSIRSIPTMLLFSNGKNIDQLVGNVPEGVISEFLKKVAK